MANKVVGRYLQDLPTSFYPVSKKYVEKSRASVYIDIVIAKPSWLEEGKATSRSSFADSSGLCCWPVCLGRSGPGRRALRRPSSRSCRLRSRFTTPADLRVARHKPQCLDACRAAPVTDTWVRHGGDKEGRSCGYSHVGCRGGVDSVPDGTAAPNSMAHVSTRLLYPYPHVTTCASQLPVTDSQRSIETAA